MLPDHVDGNDLNVCKETAGDKPPLHSVPKEDYDDGVVDRILQHRNEKFPQPSRRLYDSYGTHSNSPEKYSQNPRSYNTSSKVTSDREIVPPSSIVRTPYLSPGFIEANMDANIEINHHPMMDDSKLDPFAVTREVQELSSGKDTLTARGLLELDYVLDSHLSMDHTGKGRMQSRENLESGLSRNIITGGPLHYKSVTRTLTSMSDEETGLGLQQRCRKAPLHSTGQSMKFVRNVIRRLQNRKWQRIVGSTRSGRFHQGYIKANNDKGLPLGVDHVKYKHNPKDLSYNERRENLEGISISSDSSNRNSIELKGFQPAEKQIIKKKSEHKQRSIIQTDPETSSSEDVRLAEGNHWKYGRRDLTNLASHEVKLLIRDSARAIPFPSTQSLNRSHITSVDDEDEDDEESLDKFPHRVSWLILLLILQSLSGIILEAFEGLIRHHPVVVVFLTMLIGTGGNAGNFFLIDP